MKKLLFIVNPCAGQRKIYKHMPDVIRIFIEHGYRCETFVTGASGDGKAFLIGCARDAYDLIVCAGGDGTLSETISGMLTAQMDCPLGYIPCGTTNDYAASIGLSDDVMQAAVDAVEGDPTRLDIGCFNGEHFVYTATTGMFAKVSYTTPQSAKNVLGHMAYVLEGAKDLTAIKPVRMKIDTGEYEIDDTFLLCSITNSTSVGGILKLDEQLVSLNDGRFEVTLVKNPTTPAQFSRILYGLTAMEIPNEMIYFFSTPSLRITGEFPVEWTFDGERGPVTDHVQLDNLHSAVRIMIPKEERDNPVLAAGEEPYAEDQL